MLDRLIFLAWPRPRPPAPPFGEETRTASRKNGKSHRNRNRVAGTLRLLALSLTCRIRLPWLCWCSLRRTKQSRAPYGLIIRKKVRFVTFGGGALTRIGVGGVRIGGP